MCPACKHLLAWHDLIPVLSWVSLGGKCRYCRKPISSQYPLVELLTAGLFVGSYAVWPYGWEREGLLQFLFWLPMLIGFIALVIYDFHWMLLPNRIVFWLLGVVGVQLVLQIALFDDKVASLQAAFWGFLCLGGLFYLLFQLSNGRWIGGGDVKLGFVLGILVGGPLPAFLTLFIASLLGSLVSIPLLLTKRLSGTSRMPFGPFLITATILVYVFGQTWIAWLKGQLLIS